MPAGRLEAILAEIDRHQEIDNKQNSRHNNCSKQRPRKYEPLTIHVQIKWLEGQEGEALLKAQGRALRNVLRVIAERRRQDIGDRQETTQ